MTTQVFNLQTEDARRRQRPLPTTSGLKVTDAPLTSRADQVELLRRCEEQAWVGICGTFIEGFGRSLYSLQSFQKDDVICDYHGMVNYYSTHTPVYTPTIHIKPYPSNIFINQYYQGIDINSPT